MIKLNLGCGNDPRSGYINCDLYNNKKADMTFDCAVIPFDDNSVDEILAYHIVEHWDFLKSQEVLKEWYRALRPDGKLHVETPDLLGLCHAFIEADEQKRISLYSTFFSVPWWPGQGHYFLFTETQLRWTLEKTGFKNIKRLEPDSSYIVYPGVEKRICLNMEAFK